MFYALISVGVFVALAAKIGAILLAKEEQQARRPADKKSRQEGKETRALDPVNPSSTKGGGQR
jgi:hypothetical protein